MPIRTIDTGDSVAGFGAPVTVQAISLSGNPITGASVEMSLQNQIKRGKTDSYGKLTVQLPKNQDVEVWVSKPGVNFGSGTGIITMVRKIYAMQRTTNAEVFAVARERPAAAGFSAQTAGTQEFNLFGWASSVYDTILKPGINVVEYAINPVGTISRDIIAPEVVKAVKTVVSPEPNTNIWDDVYKQVERSVGVLTQVNSPTTEITKRAPTIPTLDTLKKPFVSAPPSPTTLLKGDVPTPKIPPVGTVNLTDLSPSGALNPIIQPPSQFQSDLIDIDGSQVTGPNVSTIADKLYKGLAITGAEKEWARLNAPSLYDMIVAVGAPPTTTPLYPVASSTKTLVAPAGKVIWNIAATGYDPVLSKQKSDRGQYASLYDAWQHYPAGESLDSFRKKFLAGEFDVDIVTTTNEIAWELANGATVVRASSYLESGGRDMVGNPTNFTVYQDEAGGIKGPVKGIGYSWSGHLEDKVVISQGGDKTTGKEGIINQLMMSNNPEMQALRSRTTDIMALSDKDANKQAVFQQMAANLIQRGSTVPDVTTPTGPLTQEDLDKLKSASNPIAVVKGITVTQGIVDKLKGGGQTAKQVVDDLVSKGISVPEIQNLPGITPLDIQNIPNIPQPGDLLDEMKGQGNLQVPVLTP